MGVGANLSFVGADVVVRHPLSLQLRNQPADRGLLLARHQVRGELETESARNKLIEELPAHRLPLFGPDPALQSLAHGFTERFDAVDIDRVEKCLIRLGKPQSLQIDDLNPHGCCRPAQIGIDDRRPSLASTSRVSPGLAPTSGLDIGNRTVLETNLRPKPKLNFLVFVQELTVRRDERQVGREIIAKLGGPFQFGNDLAVALKEIA